MKTKIIYMAMLLYALSGYGQLPTPTINVADHVMYSSAWDQFMPNIAVDKINAPNVLVSFATSSYTLHHESNYQGWYYFSPTGGITPIGNTGAVPYALSFGYPSVAFDATGLGYIMGANTNQNGFFNTTTSNQGNTWSSPATDFDATIAYNQCATPICAADDDPTSPFVNNLYTAWVDNTDSPSLIRVATSTDHGLTFTNINTLNAFYSSGTNIQTGPDGEIYVCWEDFGPLNESPAVTIGFASSMDGGVAFSPHSPSGGNDVAIEYDNESLPVENHNSDFNNTWVNSYPSMAVDKSCRSFNAEGIIYIVAATDLYPGSVIHMWYSTDKGADWNGPVTISKPGLDHCWFPWVSVDDLTGVASVVYYGSEGSVVGNTNTWVAYSNPNDPTDWGNIQVSSGAQTPAYFSPAHRSHPGYPLYLDYANGIASYGGHAYPVWQDGRTGVWQIWTADIAYDALQLQSSATTLKVCPVTPPTISGKKNFEAEDEVGVAICGGDVTVEASAIVNVTSAQSIIIGQGFSTQPGAVFTAEIKDITPCQTPGVKPFSKMPPNINSSDSSIANQNDIAGIKVYAYPNPTTDFITVGASNNNYQNISFTITDMSGRFIAQYNNPNVSGSNVLQVIDASTYAEGLYIITMITDNEKHSFKFAKE